MLFITLDIEENYVVEHSPPTETCEQVAEQIGDANKSSYGLIESHEPGEAPERSHSATVMSDDRKKNLNHLSDRAESNFFICRLLFAFCVAIFIITFYAIVSNKQTANVNVVPDLSSLSIGAQSENRINIENQENLAPGEAVSWYSGVVIRPVCFKATTRRPSHF